EKKLIVRFKVDNVLDHWVRVDGSSMEVEHGDHCSGSKSTNFDRAGGNTKE
ncbi:hypothetical protein MKX01_036559, partial [Papaver californicum]